MDSNLKEFLKDFNVDEVTYNLLLEKVSEFLESDIQPKLFEDSIKENALENEFILFITLSSFIGISDDMYNLINLKNISYIDIADKINIFNYVSHSFSNDEMCDVILSLYNNGDHPFLPEHFNFNNVLYIFRMLLSTLNSYQYSGVDYIFFVKNLVNLFNLKEDLKVDDFIYFYFLGRCVLWFVSNCELDVFKDTLSNILNDIDIDKEKEEKKEIIH